MVPSIIIIILVFCIYISQKEKIILLPTQLRHALSPVAYYNKKCVCFFELESRNVLTHRVFMLFCIGLERRHCTQMEVHSTSKKTILKKNIQINIQQNLTTKIFLSTMHRMVGYISIIRGIGTGIIIYNVIDVSLHPDQHSVSPIFIINMPVPITISLPRIENIRRLPLLGRNHQNISLVIILL